MINFLHNFHPDPILFSLGPVQIHWYGFFVVTGILAATFVSLKLAEFYKISKDKIIDLAFYLVVFGILGARIYHIFLEFPYYLNNPWDVFKIWQGGLAIHGGIIAGLAVLYYFSKKEKIDFWLLSSLVAPGLALAQTIGRWGNYFNQELFGLPTSLSWGIPIDILKRPLEFVSQEFFHPTFLYESIGSLFIFAILILFHFFIIRKRKEKAGQNIYYKLIVAIYLIMYSLLRLVTEFVRIDRTPELFNLRWPQAVSILIILLVIFVIIYHLLKNKKNFVRMN